MNRQRISLSWCLALDHEDELAAQMTEGNGEGERGEV